MMTLEEEKELANEYVELLEDYKNTQAFIGRRYGYESALEKHENLLKEKESKIEKIESELKTIQSSELTVQRKADLANMLRKLADIIGPQSNFAISRSQHSVENNGLLSRLIIYLNSAFLPYLGSSIPNDLHPGKDNIDTHLLVDFLITEADSIQKERMVNYVQLRKYYDSLLERLGDFWREKYV